SRAQLSITSRACVLTVIPRPPTSTLLPYTTLFRSRSRGPPATDQAGPDAGDRHWRPHGPGNRHRTRTLAQHDATRLEGPERHRRSEEHTSELQSRENLVCRLLLEKKKTAARHDAYS